MNKSKFCDTEKELFDDFIGSFEFAEQLEGKTVLVTGGTGLIGSYILRCLSALKTKYRLNVTIYATARDIEKTKDEKFSKSIEWLIKDLRNMNGLPDKVDIIFHTACPTQSLYLKSHPVEVMNDSITGAKDLLEYCRNHLSCRLVYISSIEIYGQKSDDSSPTKENQYGYLEHLNPRSCYPESKKLIEAMCSSYASEYGVSCMIARLTQTIGADISPADSRVFVQFARSAATNEDIVLHTEGESSKSYIHVLDAVNALFYIVFKGQPSEAHNVANEKAYISIRGLADFIADSFNSKIHVTIEKRQDLGYAPDTKINLDASKIKALGWKAKIDLHQMFSALIDAVKDSYGGAY